MATTSPDGWLAVFPAVDAHLPGFPLGGLLAFVPVGSVERAVSGAPGGALGTLLTGAGMRIGALLTIGLATGVAVGRLQWELRNRNL